VRLANFHNPIISPAKNSKKGIKEILGIPIKKSGKMKGVPIKRAPLRGR